MSKCKARQYSDQMVCHECRLVWDRNDPAPPTCPVDYPAKPGKIEAVMANLKSYVANLITDEEKNS